MLTYRRSFVPVLALIASCLLSSCSENKITVVEAYRQAYNDHNVDAVMNLISEDAVFRVSGAFDLQGKRQIRGVAEYDKVLNIHMMMRDITVVGDTVLCTLIESNDWLQAAGMEKAVYTVRFVVHEGLINAIFGVSLPATREGFGAIVTPLMAWSEINRPNELAALMVDGTFVFNARNAERFLTLLNDWIVSEENSEVAM